MIAGGVEGTEKRDRWYPENGPLLLDGIDTLLLGKPVGLCGLAHQQMLKLLPCEGISKARPSYCPVHSRPSHLRSRTMN